MDADQKSTKKAKHDDQIRPKKLGLGKFAGTKIAAGSKFLCLSPS
jgi:hypothetical protein